MDQLYMLRAFVSAAQHQSFSKAATSLGVTTGSISKAIAKLEASIQTRVLHRTTRSVTLTEEAQSYYLSCCRLLEELDEANRRIMREREVDSGKLRRDSSDAGQRDFLAVPVQLSRGCAEREPRGLRR